MTPLYLIFLSSSLFFTALILHFLIPALKSRKMGQKILDIGPRWHKSKEGTPTMGGLSFLLVFGIFLLLLLVAMIPGCKFISPPVFLPLLFTLLFALLNGAVGILDDRTKFRKGQNEGLLPWQKYLLQLLLCLLYLFAMRQIGAVDTVLYIPFFKRSFDLGFLFWPLSILLITGTVNSVNLTDGIDGLAASETAVVSAFFAACAFTLGSVPLAAFSASVIGCCLGFLLYNFHPAKVFMGDTGSLFLGAAVSGMAFLLGNPLILLVAGLMYIVESVSVILQVGYFKLTHGKRLFKMAPIHHHFEKCGWSENTIVAVFTGLTLLFCVLAYVFDIRP